MKSTNRAKSAMSCFSGMILSNEQAETLIPLGGGVKPACSLRFELGLLGLGVCNSSSLMREARCVPASVEKFSSLAVEKNLKRTLHASRFTPHAFTPGRFAHG